MFGKKDNQAEGQTNSGSTGKRAKKPSIGKIIDRKIYRVFNDKSRLRTVAFSAAFVAVPALGMATFMMDSPSSQRQDTGAEQYAQYQQDIRTLETDAQRARTPEDLASLRTRAEDLTTKIVFDSRISERDVRDLAHRFSEANDGRLDDMTGLENTYTNLERFAAELDDSRSRPDPDKDLSDARDSISSAQWETASDFVFNLWLVHFLMTGSMTAFVRGNLRKGTERDNKNQQEERSEKLAEGLDDLEDLIKPKKSADGPGQSGM